MVTGYYPKTVGDALAVKSKYDSTLLIAGGTDAMVVRKQAEHVIFINRIADLQKVELTKEYLIIGAGVPYRELLDREQVPEILKMAIRKIASPAIRNAGTMAGNICNASPAGDSLPVLYALDAQIVLAQQDAQGFIVEKRLPIEEFILGIRSIQLQKNEMVTAIEIPRASYEGLDRIYYEKVGARQSEAITKVSFVGACHLKEGKVRDMRIAFGSIGVTVLRKRELEQKMIGRTLSEIAEQKEEIVAAYMEWIHPIDDQRSTANYRKTVCRNLLSDFLSEK